MDLGRSYEAVIRVNSQSGKGGIAYLMEAEHGAVLPRRLQIEFSTVVQEVTDASGKEVTADDLWAIFSQEYLADTNLYGYVSHHLVEDSTRDEVELSTEVQHGGVKQRLSGRGNGPIDAFVAALQKLSSQKITVMDYHEHAIGAGADAKAITYIELRIDGGKPLFGVGMDSNIVTASLKALLSGLNRSLRQTLPKSAAA
jgi:2-isopropylmalate synthase